MTEAQRKQWDEIRKGLPVYKGWAIQCPDANGAWWEGYGPELQSVKAMTKAQLRRAISSRS